ncbi:hypothetical protein NMY22_g10886 [Coprinellus aureogranulatus]|nr:hypothetical protein NMY22_g10886 [Coprinellus aureogranulatus]
MISARWSPFPSWHKFRRRLLGPEANPPASTTPPSSPRFHYNLAFRSSTLPPSLTQPEVEMPARMAASRRIYPSFSLVITTATGIVKLQDFGRAVSRTVHLHIPRGQISTPLLPISFNAAASSSSSSSPPSPTPHPQAVPSSPAVSSRSSSDRLTAMVDMLMGVETTYGANNTSASESGETGPVSGSSTFPPSPVEGERQEWPRPFTFFKWLVSLLSSLFRRMYHAMA